MTLCHIHARYKSLYRGSEPRRRYVVFFKKIPDVALLFFGVTSHGQKVQVTCHVNTYLFLSTLQVRRPRNFKQVFLLKKPFQSRRGQTHVARKNGPKDKLRIG